ncbi:MAG: hypothetical protein WKF77_07550 [Planctomycetaceae bacterium]
MTRRTTAITIVHFGELWLGRQQSTVVVFQLDQPLTSLMNQS